MSSKNSTEKIDTTINVDLETLAGQWFQAAREKGLETPILEAAWSKAKQEIKDDKTLRQLLAIERAYLGLEVKLGEVSGPHEISTTTCAYLAERIKELVDQGYEILKVESIDVEREGSITVTHELTYAKPGAAQVKRYAKPFYFHTYNDEFLQGRRIKEAYDLYITQGKLDLLLSGESNGTRELNWALATIKKEHLDDSLKRGEIIRTVFDI